MSCGIYKITNQTNGKIYIGQSLNIHVRFRRHKTTAFNLNDPAYFYPLYQEIREYGIESFSFEVLEECESYETNSLEKKYILLFNSMYPNGYNLAFGTSQNRKEVFDYVEEIIALLKDSDLSIKEISEKFLLSERTIRAINVGDTWRQDYVDYPVRLQYGNDFCPICGNIKRSSRKTCSDRCRIESLKTVERPEKEILIKELQKSNFTEVGRKYGVSDNAIRNWCRGYGISDKAKDYK